MKYRNQGGRVRGRRGFSGFALGIALALVLSAAPAYSASLSGVVNVNTATATELQLLPGVGESRAKAIVAARKTLGGFRRVDDLVEVKGIGTTLLEQLRPFVALSGKTTAQIQ